MSAAPGAAAFSHSNTSQGNHAGWKSHSDHHDEYSHDADHDSTYGSAKDPLYLQDENVYRDPFAKRDPNEPFPATKEALAKQDPNELFSTTKEVDGGRKSRPENKRAHTDGAQVSLKDEENKWIHRDKLAKIESEELQAAGIILPKPRSRSRPSRDRSTDKASRDRSTDKANGSRRATDASDHQPVPRSRKSSTPITGSVEKVSDHDQGGSWDFRLPDEIAEDPNEYWITSESLGPKGSRIPVAKVSAAPIPLDYLERDAPVPRKRSGSLALPNDDFLLTNPKPRSRSNSAVLDEVIKMPAAQQRSTSEASPKKLASATKKPTPASARSASANGRGGTTRPKTRSGPGRENGSTTARPGTRSGELSPISKSPEGEPPWMVSAYKPDPRLPPDQQLLPTVARRLQQEKWEKEGKFGNTYDKEFRPLNEQEHLQPPEVLKAQPDTEQQQQQPEERADEWPLRAGEGRQEPKSPTPSRPGTGSYSTMPRLNSKSSQHPPVSSPRSPVAPQLNRMSSNPSQMTRIPTQPEQPPVQEKEEEKKEAGCGCCVIM
ncbi:hypothetical protein PG996_007978 [Apiospora saccharicola]|uniref:TeaA receptor TeaR n=1 Tax=Apiospora saccharicola TaxID=335842 RepID=A0ABR1UWK7_9PEZI